MRRYAVLEVRLTRASRMEWCIPMKSSNTEDKNLPATVEATTHKDPNGTADSRTDARRSPYFR
jgi:hypothetical protein